VGGVAGEAALPGTLCDGAPAWGPVRPAAGRRGELVELPASSTRAATSTPSASVARIASTAIGALQLGVAASRVRAAAPQERHQSCSPRRGAPHMGQASLTGADGLAAGGVATLTCPAPLAARSRWVPPRRCAALCRRLGRGRSNARPSLGTHPRQRLRDRAPLPTRCRGACGAVAAETSRRGRAREPARRCRQAPVRRPGQPAARLGERTPRLRGQVCARSRLPEPARACRWRAPRRAGSRRRAGRAHPAAWPRQSRLSPPSQRADPPRRPARSAGRRGR